MKKYLSPTVELKTFQEVDNLTTPKSVDLKSILTNKNGYIIYVNGNVKTLVCYIAKETDLTVPKGVTAINQNAFYNCDKFTSIVIPNSVASIGKNAFYNCSSLTSINYCGTEEEWEAISKDDNWNVSTSSYIINYNYVDK